MKSSATHASDSPGFEPRPPPARDHDRIKCRRSMDCLTLKGQTLGHRSITTTVDHYEHLVPEASG
jgi:hypothetical protein